MYSISSASRDANELLVRFADNLFLPKFLQTKKTTFESIITELSQHKTTYKLMMEVGGPGMLDENWFELKSLIKV